MPGQVSPRSGWREGLFNRRMLICVFTGFSSGLPLYILLSLLPAWLRSEHVDLRAIGFFALMQFPFNWKFLWSPFLDRYALPAFGRRRGWMLASQIALLIALPVFGALDPEFDLLAIRVQHDILRRAEECDAHREQRDRQQVEFRIERAERGQRDQ